MLSFLLGESEPWLLASTAGILGLLIVIHFIIKRLSMGGQRDHSKPVEEKISAPAQVDPQIQVVKVCQQNTTKDVQLSRGINRSAFFIR